MQGALDCPRIRSIKVLVNKFGNLQLLDSETDDSVAIFLRGTWSRGNHSREKGSICPDSLQDCFDFAFKWGTQLPLHYDVPS